MTAILRLSLFAFLLTACGKPHETLEMEKSKYAVIDSIHIVEMKNHRLLMAAEKQLDSLKTIIHSEINPVLTQQLDSVTKSVQSAIQRMNQIMPGLAQPDYMELSHEEVMAILDQQMAGLDSVTRQMENARVLSDRFLKKADSLLAVYGKKMR